MKIGNRFLSSHSKTKFIILIAVLLVGLILYSVIKERTAPTSPSHLHAVNITSSSVTLAWDKPAHVKDYEVYQNNKVIGTTAANQYTVKHLYPGTPYRFYIKARDARGNTSEPSHTIKVATLAAKQPIVSKIQVSPIASDKKTISGTVTLSVKVGDDKKISKVEFYSNNGNYLIKTVTKAPYRVSWDTNPWVPDGPQVLKVVAYDSANRVSQVTRTVVVKNTGTGGAYKRIGYYTNWSAYSNFQVSDIDASMLTQLNYAFAGISSDGKIALGKPEVDVQKSFPGDRAGQSYEGNFYQLTKLKQKYPNLKTVISVGGWDGSAKFSDVALTDQSRTIFANSSLEFILKYGFDGIDLDWEYPVAGGKPGNIKRPEDKQNFTLLVQKIRETFDAQSAKDGKTYLLTITGGAGNGFAADTELNLLQQYVDSIGLMAYDIHGSWDNITGMDAPLYQDPTSGFHSDESVQDAVQIYLRNGVRANKLVLGVPLYGRVYKQVNNQNNGLYQPFTGGGTAVGYGNIVANDLNKNGFIRYWDSSSQVPWLFNGSEFISYDDPESIGYKTAFIKSMGLGGAMMWELSQDPNKELISKIYHDLQ
jgi:chitinase